LKREDLARLFVTFRHSAFRLETLPAYAVAEETESFTAWKEGQPPPAWNTERLWLKVVAEATAAGKFMQRVRVVRQPLTDYQRFSFDWGYPGNVEAGEDIRILELGRDETLPWIPDPEAGHDFWCFDAVTVVRMEYDGAGRFIRPVDASANEVPFIACRDWAVSRAVPFSDYRATI
jgi:hypothetical protein